MTDWRDGVLHELGDMMGETLDRARELVQIPTVNPPGAAYPDAADALHRTMSADGLDVVRIDGPTDDDRYPRTNVMGTVDGAASGPCIHVNGHIDVVPVGEGWTVDPFDATVDGDRLYGRGTADMKCGLVAGLFAVLAIRRAGVPFSGRLEVSGTVDEESGGQAGVGFLAESGRISAQRTDHVIIPEPFGVDRICVGHRGVYWFRVTTHGRIAHGSMPFLGINAVDRMRAFLDELDQRLGPVLDGAPTDLPVVPDAARQPTINLNTIQAGQLGDVVQTPCVPDRCTATFDRRFLPEETFDAVREQIIAVVRDLSTDDAPIEVEDLLEVHPTVTPSDDPLVRALTNAIGEVIPGGNPQIVASPGTYDHKHVTRIGGVRSCVAYGPGTLELAHVPDEHCSIEAMHTSARVMAVAILELLGH